MKEPQTKKILFTINGGWVERNILRSSVMDMLLKPGNVEILLLVPAGDRDWYEQEFSDSYIRIIPVKRHKLSRYRRFLAFLAVNGLPPEDLKWLHEKQLFRTHKRFSYWLKRIFSWILRASVFHVALVRICGYFCQPNHRLGTLLSEIRPDVAVLTNIRSTLDFEILVAAKKMSIRTVGMVRNYDSLSPTLGILPIIPDLMVLQNRYLYQQATVLHRISSHKIVITGVPQYDWYAQDDLHVSRREFLAQWGFAEDAKLLLFASGGVVSDAVAIQSGKLELATFEVDIVRSISQAIASGVLPAESRILFRPHPHFPLDFELLRTIPFVAIDDMIVRYDGSGRATEKQHMRGIRNLMNSLYHADCVITTTSSIILDATAYKKPVISVAYDGNQTREYWRSIRQYFDVPAVRDILNTGVPKVVHTDAELITALDIYLSHLAQDAEARQRLFDGYVGTLDGHAAQRIADEIIAAMIR